LRLAISLVSLLVLSVFTTALQAQSAGIAGKYQCSKVKVHGQVKPCGSAHLTLRKDGRFELRGWEGNYVVSGEYVELSDTLVKSKAKIEPGYRIVFRYHSKEGQVEVIYERRLSAPGEAALS
jgi:hypothetical protein